MAETETIVVLSMGATQVKAKWFVGTADAAVTRVICSALNLPAATEIQMVDSDGFHVPPCGQLPSGAYQVTVGSTLSTERIHMSLNGIETPLSASPRGGGFELDEPLIENRSNSILSEGTLENRLVKFERMTSHLANERTFLAWVRTSASVAGLAVTYSTNYYRPRLSLIYWLGSVFAWCVGVYFFGTGVRRYWTVKSVLNRRKEDITNQWGRKGVGFVVALFGIFLALMSAMFLKDVYSEVEDGD
jgi:putative membrane protein